tara:strand:+ start:118 stop:4305 length:4188 start_codon:yes stop_codon:yes gene_type:complete
MAIDKMIPRFLVSDEDERLLQAGAMTDALNVSISEDEDGSEGVIKNVKGTSNALAVSGSELTASDDVTVIGQVSDPQRGFIYFFVADDSATSGNSYAGAEHAIYQYNTKSTTNEGLAANSYRLVLKGAALAFDPAGFIKVDVVNAAFQQDGILKTALYFTDNLNPPRKINVDRAVAGDYSGAVGFDLAFSSIKAAPNVSPSSSFSTDTSVDTNMFSSNSFQYATQYIYKDGEESAISSYSELATSKSVFFGSIDDTAYAVARNTENVCDVVLNINKQMPDLDKVRLLARKGNDGSFFIIDEFDPLVSKDRGDGSSGHTPLYTASSQTYHFRNDTLGSTVPNTVADKMYDNVPLLAKGQAVAGNRLIYSNYTEGRANTSPAVNLTPFYNAPGVSGSDLIDDSGSTLIDHIIDPGAIGVKIEIYGLFGETSYSASDKVPAGTTTNISFVYKPLFNLVHGSSNIISIPTTAGTNLTATSLDLDTLAAGYPDQTLTITARNTTEVNYNDLRTLLVNNLDAKTITIDYNIAGQALSDSKTVTAGTASVTFRFDSSVTASVDGEFTLNPLVESIILTNVTLSDSLQWDAFQAFGEDRDVLQSGSQNPSTPSGAHISSRAASATSIGNIKSFKAGSTHELGVVYYDKFNRSGNVNRLGSFYAEWFGGGARPANKEGPTAVNIDWASYAPPSWADRWQIVYNGGSSYDSYVQYTTGGGFYVRYPSNHAKNPNDKRIFVNIDSLDEYKEDRGALRSYSFTEGDKLRVISYDSATGATPSIEYPKAADNGIIEFNILGVKELGASDNPIASAGTPKPEEQGTFLVLEHPSISSGVDGERFAGFDWYSISNTNYDDSTTTSTSNTNLWGKQCVVEFMTPKKSTSEDVFYEIGVGGRCGERKDTSITNAHGPDIKIDNGDVHYRLVRCKGPDQDGSTTYATNIAADAAFTYRSIAIENETVSDQVLTKDWDKGRAHVVFEPSAEVRRYNGLTYSDAYEDDVANLSLSSFNASLGNFDSLESKFGAVNYIGNYNDSLVAIQENKLSLVPVNKNIIQYAEGSGNVALSTKVLNSPSYSSGDYGCGDNPESVLIQDSSVYFADKSRQAVCVLTGGQLVPISEKNMSSFFRTFFATDNTKYVSGYDSRENAYYLTALGGTTPETVGYDASIKVWQSKYSFTPDIYSNQNNTLYSAKYVTGSPAKAFWRHDSATRNNFYDTSYPSEVEVVSKISPSRVKVYNAVSYEGDSDAWDMSPVSTDLDQTSGTITSWSKKEGSYYASMPRDASDESTSHKIYLGNLTDSGDGLTFTSTVRLSRLPIPLGNQAITQPTGSDITFNIASVAGNSITFGEDASPTSGHTYLVLSPSLNGDPMRGHWAKIKLTNSSNTKHELYCINTHVTDSKSHHPLGQQ